MRSCQQLLLRICKVWRFAQLFSDIFMHLLHEHHITAYQLSKETNLSESLISNWKSGRQLPNYSSIKILSDYFNVSSDYLLERTDDPKTYYLDENYFDRNPEDKKKYRLLSLLPSSIFYTKPFWITPQDEERITLKRVICDDISINAAFLLILNSDSLEPRYFEGDLLMIQVNANIGDGDLCVVNYLGSDHFLMKNGSSYLTINPNSLQIEISENEKVDFIGKIIGKIDL